jgi:hypothetical protein
MANPCCGRPDIFCLSSEGFECLNCGRVHGHRRPATEAEANLASLRDQLARAEARGDKSRARYLRQRHIPRAQRAVDFEHRNSARVLDKRHNDGTVQS